MPTKVIVYRGKAAGIMPWLSTMSAQGNLKLIQIDTLGRELAAGKK